MARNGMAIASSFFQKRERRDVKSRGWKFIRWGMYRGNVVIEHKERLRARYEQLSEEVEGLEEWKKCERRLRKLQKFCVEGHQERVHHRRIETRSGGWLK